jgi:hypothetical protein
MPKSEATWCNVIARRCRVRGLPICLFTELPIRVKLNELVLRVLERRSVTTGELG